MVNLINKILNFSYHILNFMFIYWTETFRSIPVLFFIYWDKNRKLASETKQVSGFWSQYLHHLSSSSLSTLFSFHPSITLVYFLPLIFLSSIKFELKTFSNDSFNVFNVVCSYSLCDWYSYLISFNNIKSLLLLVLM